MDFITSIIDFVKDINITEVVTAVLAILGGFSVLAKLTPSKADDKVIAAILKVIHGLGLTKEKK